MIEPPSPIHYPWKRVNPDLMMKTPIAHTENSIKISSKNIQNCMDPFAWKSLCDQDIILIQELKINNTTHMDEEILKKFRSTFSNETQNIFLQRTAVLFRKSKFTLVHAHFIHKRVNPQLSPFVSDVLIKEKHTSEIWLVIFIYAPCGKYKSQRELLAQMGWAIQGLFTTCAAKFPDIHIILCGDFNNVMNGSIDTTNQKALDPGLVVVRPRLMLQDILDTYHLTDCFRTLFPHVAHATNKASGDYSNRRLDRIYIPQQMLTKFYSYGERKDPRFGSTHVTFMANILIDTYCPLHIGKPRFIADVDLLELKSIAKCFNAGRFEDSWDKVSDIAISSGI